MLTKIAAILGLAVVPLVCFLPVYSSGETLVDQADTVFYLALSIGVLLACVPLLAGGAHARRWVRGFCGTLLFLSSFVTVLGVFFLPSAGLLLLTLFAKPGSALPGKGKPGTSA